MSITQTLVKQIKATLLVVGITLGVMFGSTQQSKASYYDNYYSYYQTYNNYYNVYHNPYYLYTAYAFYFYYLSGYYGDSYAFRYDPYGDYSDKHLSTSYYSSYTYHDNYYNYYAWLGDLYWRFYNSAPSR
jgi:hypothetical protein